MTGEFYFIAAMGIAEEKSKSISLPALIVCLLLTNGYLDFRNS